MIVTMGSWIVAFLADGRIARWRNEGTDPLISPDRTITMFGSEIEILAKSTACVIQSAALIMTPDYRYLYGQSVEGGFRDITATICNALSLGHTELSDNITGMLAGNDFVAVRTDDRVCIMAPPYNSPNDNHIMHHKVYSFSSSINLFCYQNNRAFIRTGNGKLYVIGVYYYGMGNTIDWHDHREIRVKDALSISEIVYTESHILFLTKGGRVCGHKFTYRDSDEISGPFDTITFPEPESESVAKIVCNQYVIIYVTLNGNCYFVRQFSHPTRIEQLSGRFVTNAFILHDHIIVQYDTGRLCSIGLTQEPYDLTRSPLEQMVTYDLGPVIDLPFFDDKNVVSVMESCGIYFVSSSGQVYWSRNLEPGYSIETISFFDSNPVAIDISCTIPSAQSMLK